MNALDLVYMTGAAVLAPWWMRKARGGWPERFGRTPALPPAGRPRVLLHAVSVGETNALRTLVPLLTPHAEVVISATTDTGLARARELYAASSTVVRFPLDFSWSVRRFLDAVRPDAAVFVELELWPNFIAECRRRRIPACVINGRLSERSFRGYRRVRPFLCRSFASLDFAAVQDNDYAERFRRMGVPNDRCRVTGSMKWDAAKIEDEVPGASDLGIAMGIDHARPLVVAGSTGPGEEALLHAACPAGVQLLCAPRKPERFDEAAAAMPGCVRRSRVRSGTALGERTNRFLLDSIGELRGAYALADVVVIGRSFGDLFGSDPVEPVALGKPTLIGPSYGDFAFAVAALTEAGGLAVTSRDQLSSDLAALLGDPGRRRAIAERGRACVRAHQGASERHAGLIQDLLLRRAKPEPDHAGSVR